MKRLHKTAVLLAVLVLAVACWYGWSRYRQRDAGPLVIYGNVDIRTVNLSFRVGGRLEALHVDEGDAVESGRVLALLDPAPYENALAGARAAVLARQAALALLEEGFRTEETAQVRAEREERRVALDYAETALARVQQLVKSHAVSQDAVDAARNARDQARAAFQAAQDKLALYESGSRRQDIDMARAQLLQAQAACAQAELDAADTVLKSPSDGTILTRAVEAGSMLNPGATVFTLSLTRPVWVRAYVDGHSLHRAVPGASVRISTDARPDRPYTGSIGFVSPTAEFTPKSVQTPELRTDLVYRLRIIVNDPDDALRQGMPVTVHFSEAS